MVVLLVTYDIDNAVQRILLETLQRRSEVLRHIYRCTIATKQQLLVESIAFEVNPYRAVLFAEEYALRQALLDKSLAENIGLRLVVNLIEINAESLVGYIETIIYPTVHLLPKRTHFGIFCLPLAQHLLRFEEYRSLLLCLLLAHSACNEFFNLCLVVLVELHIVVAYEVVALLAGRFRCSTIAIAQPRNHRLADMNTSVIYKVCLDDIVSVSRQNLCHRVTQKVVADMSEVEWLVGVWRGVLNHYCTTCWLCYAIVFVGCNLLETLHPELLVEREVKEAFDNIKCAELSSRCNDLFANLGSHRLGCFASHLDEWEYHESIVALELLASLLNLYLRVGNLAIESLYGSLHHACNVLFDIHFSTIIFVWAQR